MSTLASKQLGSWTLVDKLGEGGNAEVWRATDVNGLQVAIKLLKTRKINTDPYLRFVREIEVHHGLSREGFQGILPLLESSLPLRPSAAEPAWLALPIAQSLRSALEDAALTQVVESMAAVADVVARLAERGIAHRDIKPENIYILNGQIAVGDLGLIAIPDAEPLTTGAKALGQRHYLAPEMISSPAGAKGPPADVYSLAKTLWVLATGQRFPLPGQHRLEDQAMTISATVVDPRSTQVDLLIERATATNPDDRPTAAELRDELRSLLRESVKPSAQPRLSEIGRRIGVAMKVARRSEDCEKRWVAMARAALQKLAAGPETAHQRLKEVDIESSFSAANNPTVVDAVINESRMKRHAWSDGGATAVIYRLPGRTASGHTPGVTYWCGVGVVMDEGGVATVVAAHVMATNQQGYGIIWSDTRRAHLGSAVLDQHIEEIVTLLLDNLETALARALARFEQEVSKLR